MSSTISTIIGCYQTTYGCTKTFERHFFQTLQQELKEKHSNLEQLIIAPMYVSSQMTGNMKPDGFNVIYPEQYVSGVFRGIGRVDILFGPWLHEVQGSITHAFTKLTSQFSFPKYIFNHIVKTQCDKMTN